MAVKRPCAARRRALARLPRRACRMACEDRSRTQRAAGAPRQARSRRLYPRQLPPCFGPEHEQNRAMVAIRGYAGALCVSSLLFPPERVPETPSLGRPRSPPPFPRPGSRLAGLRRFNPRATEKCFPRNFYFFWPWTRKTTATTAF